MVTSIQELADTVKCLTLVSPPAGNRVALVTHTAGPAIIAADILETGWDDNTGSPGGHEDRSGEEENCAVLYCGEQSC